MFCQTIISDPVPELFKFALPHAVQLAESGQTLRDRRIAYQYCIQYLPPDHELSLMLVNTIRKDLESRNDARISLALDYLLQLPARMRPLIKRQALLVINSLLKFDRSLTTHLVPRLLKRAKNSELGIAVIALDLLFHSQQNTVTSDDIIQILLSRMWTVSGPSQPLIKSLELLEQLLINDTGTPHEDTAINVLSRLLSTTGNRTALEYGVLLGTCRCLSRLSPSKLADRFNNGVESTPKVAPLTHLRPLLSSDNPNAVYAFLSCLAVLSPSLWAGSGADISHTEQTTLKEQEVGKIMMFLDSNDASLRQKAYAVLNAVDAALLRAHYATIMNAVSILPPGNVAGGGQPAIRALEVLEALKPSTQTYIDGIKSILIKIEEPYSTSVSKGRGSSVSGSTTRNLRHSLPVMEAFVEKVLLHLTQVPTEDRKMVVHAMIAIGINDGHLIGSPRSFHRSNVAKCPYGPTGYTLLAAAVAEYGGLVDVSAESMLQALIRPLKLASPAVQEVLLLSVLRVLSRCDQRPLWLYETISAIKIRAGRHIAFRCQQILDLSEKLDELRRIVATAKSSSLPDFLFALESRSLPSDLPETVASPVPKATKLRYASYEPPPSVAPRGRRPRGSSRSTSVSAHSHQEVTDSDEPLSRTMTAGELTLTSGSRWFQPSKSKTRQAEQRNFDLITDRLDLISLDTPFRTENQIQSLSPVLQPSSPLASEEFNLIWGQTASPRASARGWSSSSPLSLKTRLEISSSYSALSVQKQPHDPFTPEPAEILVLVHSSQRDSKVAVRLQPGADGSCLWQIRGGDQEALSDLKRVFSEDD
ncbi:armadillo-type protein [Cantharellus anzutake]|uniref:armadillo-type protein n=1 Tax=Cantharellus anzutake TaxID=1750568 RepID=UPI001905781B|nr:armadillo-type protein [Cantharellus anzutake]KAF8331915.1 armadillo-type protein [Cantharellus anzutake]